MRLFGKTWNLDFLFTKADKDTQKKERFITNIIRTHAFAKLSVQDKMLSLGKLINIFRADCGFTPKSLERTMNTLSIQLKTQTDKVWRNLYSTPYEKVKKGA